MDALLGAAPSGSLISFEGELVGSLVPKFLFAEEEVGILKRNTLTPRQDFWVFELNAATRDYVKNELAKRIGLLANVLHIHIIHESKVLFASYDRFGEGCVVLAQSGLLTEAELQGLVEEGVIGEFRI